VSEQDVELHRCAFGAVNARNVDAAAAVCDLSSPCSTTWAARAAPTTIAA